MTTPAVSVCIPVYNGERFIGETLESVFGQARDDCEVVVVDNASTDATLAVVDRFADRGVRVVRSDTNIGAVRNWSRALTLARARFVKLVCADDTLAPGCLDGQVALLEAHPEVAFVAGQRDIVDEDGATLMSARGLGRLDGVVGSADALRATVRGGTNIFGEVGCVLMRAEVAARCGGFDARWPYMVDLDYWCRMLDLGPMYAQRASVATFRVSSGAWSVELGNQQRRQAAALFRHLRAGHPDTLDRGDVLFGTARAGALAAGRAATYRALSLRRRLRSRR